MWNEYEYEHTYYDGDDNVDGDGDRNDDDNETPHANHADYNGSAHENNVDDDYEDEEQEQ